MCIKNNKKIYHSLAIVLQILATLIIKIASYVLCYDPNVLLYYVWHFHTIMEFYYIYFRNFTRTDIPSIPFTDAIIITTYMYYGLNLLLKVVDIGPVIDARVAVLLQIVKDLVLVHVNPHEFFEIPFLGVPLYSVVFRFFSAREDILSTDLAQR